MDKNFYILKRKIEKKREEFIDIVKKRQEFIAINRKREEFIAKNNDDALFLKKMFLILENFQIY